MSRILATDASFQSLVLRLTAALVFFPHGAQKLLGWFGGYGWSGTMGFLTGTVGLPTPVAALVILGESLGALGLALGLFTRGWALVLAATMLGAIFTVHQPLHFFMDWSGQQGAEGIEYHLLALALLGSLVVRGGGAWSLDGVLAKRAASVTVAAPQPVLAK